MYQYILFDLDGTLTNPKTGICSAVQYALKDAGIEEDNLDVLEPFIGPPLKDSFHEFYHMSDEQIERAVKKYREYFQDKGIYENEIYPGIADMLMQLQAKGKKLGIASSKPTVFVDKILDYFHIKQYFDVIVGSELDGRRGKKEEVVEEALKQLIPEGKINYDKCVMVGDRKFDMEGAIAHVIDSIGVSYGYGGKEELEAAGATYIVSTVQELEQLLNKDTNCHAHNIVRRNPIATENSKATVVNKSTSAMFSFYKAWEILFPILLYWTISNIILIAGVVAVQLCLGTQENIAALMGTEWTARISVGLNTLAMLGTIPFTYAMVRKEHLQYGNGKNAILKHAVSKDRILFDCLIVILGVSSALTFNMLLSYIDFSDFSAGYREVVRMQYSVSMPAGILIYGVISPVAEEMVFRGLVMKRLQRYFSPIVAILVSAFIFGMYHGNIVQGVYAFLLGILIAGSYCYSDNLFVPVLFHGAANIAVFVLTYNREVEKMVNQPLNCAIFAIISALTIFYLYKMKKDEKNILL